MIRPRVAVLWIACLGLALAPWIRLSANAALASTEYVHIVEKILAESSVLIPERLERVRELYEQARTMHSDDPWLDYAYGLVLLRIRKHDEGIAALNEAAEKGLHHDLSLHRLLIRSQCENGSLEADLASLWDYAAILEAGDGTAADAADRREGAAFLGRLVAYLAGPGSRKTESQEGIKTVDQRLRQQLPETLRREYDKGKADVELRYRESQSAAVEAHRERQATEREELVNRTEQLQADAQAAENALIVGGQRTQQTLAALTQEVALARSNARAIQQQINTIRRSPFRVSTAALERQKSMLDSRVRAAECRILHLRRDYDKLRRQRDRLAQAHLRSERRLSQDSTHKLPGQAQRELRSLDNYIPLDYQRECARVLDNIRQLEMSHPE